MSNSFCPKCGASPPLFSCRRSMCKPAPPAHSKSEYRRLEAQGIPVSPPADEPTPSAEWVRDTLHRHEPERPSDWKDVACENITALLKPVETSDEQAEADDYTRKRDAAMEYVKAGKK